MFERTDVVNFGAKAQPWRFNFIGIFDERRY